MLFAKDQQKTNHTVGHKHLLRGVRMHQLTCGILPPTHVSSPRTFCKMLNYYSHYLPTSPLTQLVTRKRTEFSKENLKINCLLLFSNLLLYHKTPGSCLNSASLSVERQSAAGDGDMVRTVPTGPHQAQKEDMLKKMWSDGREITRFGNQLLLLFWMMFEQVLMSL